MKKRPINLKIGFSISIALLLVALIGFFWTPYKIDEINFSVRLASPSFKHIFGTDQFGRDILSRLMVGSSNALIISILSVFISSIVGITLGLIAGYFTGFLDDLIMRFMEIISSIPTILLALLLSVSLGPGLISATIAVGLASIPIFVRICRANVLVIRSLTFIEAAKAIGNQEFRLIWRHVLPNILSPLLIQITQTMGIAILAESGLSYLGLSVQPPTPSWGQMLRDASSFLEQSIWPTIFPGLAIVFSVIGFNLLGDGLHDFYQGQDSGL